MEFIFEVIVEFFAEVLFQGVWEFLFSGLSFPDSKKRPGLFLFVMCLLLGLATGYGSLFIFKQSILSSAGTRIIYLIVGPVVVGLLLFYLSKLKKRRKHGLFLFSSFLNTYVFALSFALIRFFFIK